MLVLFLATVFWIPSTHGAASEANGESCFLDRDCIPGENCVYAGGIDFYHPNLSRKCFDGSEDDRCESNTDCQEGLVCRGGVGAVNSRCKPPGSHGDKCNSDRDCKFYCHNLRCRDGSEGAPCKGSSDCQDGLTCKGILGLGKCTNKKESGRCTHDNDCVGYCEGLHCQLGLEGQQCRQTSECLPGLSCKKTCRSCIRRRCRGTPVDFEVPVHITSASHGKALALKDIHTKGAKVFVFHPRHYSGYQWAVESGSDTRSNIVRFRHIAANLCLSLPASENKNGGQPVVDSCRGNAPEQLWEIRNEEIRSARFGRCLNLISPNEVREGGSLSVWKCGSHKDQNWKVVTI